MAEYGYERFTLSAALSPCRRHLALGSTQDVTIWSLSEGRLLQRCTEYDFGARLEWRNTPAGCLRWRPDGKRLAYVHNGCFIKSIDPFAPGWPADIQIVDYGGHITPFSWGWIGCQGIAVSVIADEERLPLRAAGAGPVAQVEDLPEALGGFTQRGPYGHIRSVDTELTGRWLGLYVEDLPRPYSRPRLVCLDRTARTITCDQPVGTLQRWKLAVDRVALSPSAAGRDKIGWVPHDGLRILQPSTGALLAEHDFTNILELHWAPSGTQLAVVRRPDGSDPRAIIFVEDHFVLGAVRTQVTVGVSELADRRLLDWAPDGRAVVLRAHPYPELWSATSAPELLGRLEGDEPVEAVFWGEGGVALLSLGGVSFWVPETQAVRPTFPERA